jgi:Methylamine utilisation protein MauE
VAGVIAALVLALVLLASSAFKLASPGSSQAAMATFGVRRPATRAAVWAALIWTELVLAAGVAAGIDAAAYAAALMMIAFATAMVIALARGRAGAPCACFGARSRVGWPAVARNVALAAAFAALPLLPRRDLSSDEWFAIGLAVALAACLGLAIAVLALAREVGMLRLRLGPESALEIPEEGPAVGSHVELIERFSPGDRAELALAVFVSESCAICSALEPSIESLAREPILALEVFAEGAESEAWRELEVPGSPYAVAMSLDGTALAKGTFNNLAQLESVLATAERRSSASAREAIGG